jgi:hypothetical protein
MGHNSDSETICKQNADHFHNISKEIELQLGKWIVRNTFAYLLACPSWCKTGQGIPVEEGRVWCLEDAIGEYFNIIERLLF